ncbi:MAG: carbohydrate ABC transporter permease [Lachnospiraceae bacterium]|nr:carbohydrate ABC transporter permease [Lachnospiraceae bacterium]
MRKMIKKIKTAGTYIFLSITSLCFLLPLYYVFCLASGGSIDPREGLPHPGLDLWKNISFILFKTDFMHSFLYTLSYTLVQTFLTLVVCALAGYGFEIYNDRHKDKFFKVILWTYMVPFTTFVVPMFMIFGDLGMVNTTTAMILPFIASPLIIMVFRQQSRAFPKELIEAARMDGLREPFIFLRVYVPNMKPTFACGVIIAFLNGWNSYQWPRIIMQNDEVMAMTVYLTHQGHGNTMTLILMSMIPTLIVFFAFQKYFVEGMKGALQ